MRPIDLHEIYAFGWMQQGLFGAGVFFFSGAFWLALAILEQQKDGFVLNPYLIICGLSMLFGIVLGIVGVIMFSLRQKKIAHYLPQD